MITVNKKVNLTQLDQELNGEGLIASVDENREIIAVALAENNSATQEQLQVALDAHVAIFSEPTLEEKLTTVGLSLSELKTALGL